MIACQKLPSGVSIVLADRVRFVEEVEVEPEAGAAERRNRVEQACEVVGTQRLDRGVPGPSEVHSAGRREQSATAGP